jgi:tyrosyl-tRNA synthetase
MADARRLIQQGGVRVDGERCTKADSEVAILKDQTVLLQVGKRRFVKVRGADKVIEVADEYKHLFKQDE